MTQPNEDKPILVKVLDRMEERHLQTQSPALTLMMVLGLKQLGLGIHENPDSPLVQAVKRVTIVGDLFAAEMTRMLAEIVRHQHDGVMPDDLFRDHHDLMEAYDHTKKKYLSL